MARGGEVTGHPLDERDESLVPLSAALLDDPLEYLFAEHMRLRCLCAALRRIASAGRVDHILARCLASQLGNELAQHHEDEDLDFFPAVLGRSLPEDDLAAIIAQLSDDHRRSGFVARRIAEALARSAPQTPLELDADSIETMRIYAENENRHLAIENAIVMVIARKRLKLEDLNVISRRMKTRRGVPT